MNLRCVTFLLIMLGTFLLVGCGSNDPVIETPEGGYGELDDAEAIKQRLDTIIQEGQAGSATMGLYEGIDGLSIDDEKKNSLLNDLGELDASRNAEEVKAIAQRMKDKL